MRTGAAKNAGATQCLHSITFTLLMLGAMALPSLMASGQESTSQQGKSLLPAAQLIICEREYINFAFGRVHKGIYVDHEGNVYSYAYRRGDKAWQRSKDGTYTEAELMEKYDHGKQLIAKVYSCELEAKRKLIPKAGEGPYSERILRGADQGTYASACYLYDTPTGKYREVTLRTTGDQRYENLSAEAKILSAWLESLAAKPASR